MTKEEIEDTWRLLKARTPGKWDLSACPDSETDNIHTVFAPSGLNIAYVEWDRLDDAELIAACPELLEAALKEIERQREEIEKLNIAKDEICEPRDVLTEAEADAFVDHVKRCADEVDKWPEWKKTGRTK